MKKLASKAKPTEILLGVLALIAVVTIVPHAFAQLSYTDANNPHGPMAPLGWAAGIAVAGVMSGIGAWTAVRRGKLH